MGGGRGVKARAFVVGACLLVIVVSLLEVVSSLYYHLAVPAQTREALEPILGISGPERLDILRYKAHPYLNYVFNPDYAYADGMRPYNAAGFRAPEWKPKDAATIRIVAVGASTTYGIFSRDGRGIWPDLLQRRLGAGDPRAVEVVNLGVTGYTVNEILGVMTTVVPELRPDIVLVHVGANDAFAACYPDEGGWDNTRFRFSWNARPLSALARAGMRRSYFLRVAGLRLLSVKRLLPGDLMEAMQYGHPPDEEAGRNAARATGKYFRRHLQTIVALARDAGAVPVLLTHPLNPDWEAVDSPFFQGVIAAHRRNNGIIREVGEAAHAPVVDLYGGMRRAGLFVDAIHENPEGEALKTSLIYPAVREVVAAIQGRRRGAPSPPP
jgi:lysophospholipase L1-like esterase